MSTSRILLLVVATILSVWLIAATIHRLAALIAYVAVFGIGYLVGTARGGSSAD
jgi:uncharacterized protein YebE (UPF0316 family)